MDLSKRLAEFRANDNYCDVELVVEGRSFRAHRVVLAAASDYFHAMFGGSFKEKDQDRVELKRMTSTSFENFLNFVYDKNYELTEEIAAQTLIVADLTQCNQLKDDCVSYLLDHIKADNCMEMYDIGCTYHSDALIRRSARAIAKKFGDASIQESLRILPKDAIVNLMGSEALKKGCTEWELYKAARSWLEHNPEKWETPMELMKSVNFKRMHPTKVNKVTSSQLVQQHQDFAYHLLQENVAARSLPAQQRHSRTIVALSCEEQLLRCLYDAEHVEPTTLLKTSFRLLPFDSDVYLPDHSAVVGVDEELYIIGGSSSDFEAMHTNISVDVAKNIWREKPPMPASARNMAIFVLRKKYIFVVGGREGATVHGRVFRYDIEYSSWQTKQDAPAAFFSAVACLCKEEAFVTGGMDEDLTRVDHIYSYIEGEDRWFLRARMLRARKDHGAFSQGSTLYLVGGDLPNPQCQSVETFDSDANQHTMIGLMSKYRPVSLPFMVFDGDRHIYEFYERCLYRHRATNATGSRTKPALPLSYVKLCTSDMNVSGLALVDMITL